MDALVVGAIRHEGDLPRSVQHLKEHISYLEANLPGDIHSEAQEALHKLAVKRPDIFSGRDSQQIREMFADLSFDCS
jgi:hypothetical protein